MSVAARDVIYVAAVSALILAVVPWAAYSAMAVLFGPTPVPYLPPAVASTAAPATTRHAAPSPSHHRRHHAPPRASVAPVSAVPVPTRQPARTVTRTPAFTTLRPSESVSPTPAYSPAATETPTASPEPSTATPAPTSPLPTAESGSGT